MQTGAMHQQQPPLPSPTLEPADTHAPDELLSQFTKIIVAEELDTTGNGEPDMVRVDGHDYPLEDWTLSKFNLLGRRIERDNAQKVKNNTQLIREFNKYEFKSSKLWQCAGGVSTAATFGLYLCKKRKTIPPGYFGHFISDQRHMLKPAGIHSLVSTADKWQGDIPIDDPTQRCRKFGDKVILQVPENHIAGGYRVGQHSKDALDQEFVLFSQGRHVLPESKYNGVCIIKLENQQDKLGPLHVLYVREGFLGGAYQRKTGVYQILYPGPPYLLHEQEYDAVELVQRTNDVFRLGPYEFVTVKDGEVAGAYRKADGTFQILPPGHSYQLHSKDFSRVEIIRRTTQFKLGPYYYLTVRNGVEAGVYRKKDGTFQRLPAGKTYQLNQDEYREPLQVVRDSHICNIGPLTLLTVQDGFLNGAYRHADGAFIEFSDPNREYILHEKEYFELSTVTKYSNQLQMFGPFKVITIREGEVGLFEKEGTIEIKEPGFYKVAAEYNINESIPMQIFQEILPNVQFRTKDGVQMDVKFTITWHVDEPLCIAKFNGSFLDLRKLMTSRAQDALVRLCKMCSRGDLLPTKQDVATTDAMQDDEQREKAAADSHRELVGTLANLCRDELQAISKTSKLGIAIEKVMIEQFRLRDESILQDLEDMTKAELAKKAEKVRGELAIAKAGFEMAVREKKATAEAEYMQARAKDEIIAREQRAKAEATLELARTEFELQAREKRSVAEAKLAKAAETAKGELDVAKAENELRARAKLTEANASIQLKEATAQANVRQLKVETETKARLQEAEAENQIRKTQEATAALIASQRMVMEAEAEAKAIAAIAEAEYNKKMKECDAAAHMAPQEFELQKLQIQKEMQVEMMAGIGKAAWKYPDVYTGFLEQIQDVVKIAPQKTNHAMASLFPHLIAGASTSATPADSTPMDDTGKLLFHDLLKRQQFAAPNAPKRTRSNTHQTSSQL